MSQTNPSTCRRAAIILAGGEGTRLSELTRQIAGFPVPKQFCPLIGEKTPLEQTRRRVALSVSLERVYFALNRQHEKFFAPLLADSPARNLVVQPNNRGTAPAILHSLFRLAEAEPQATVLLMPSDHHVGNEAALANCIDRAFDAVERRPESTLLLGITPDCPETAYGWIEPELAPHPGLPDVFPVRRFWEKPAPEAAHALMAKGCLWNSFIIVGQLPALAGLFIRALPGLYFAFSKIRASFGTAFEEQALIGLYEHMRPSDFSRPVLETAATDLSVMAARDIGWSDLGEPRRVTQALASIGAEQSRTAAQPHKTKRAIERYDEAADVGNRNFRRLGFVADCVRAASGLAGR